MFYLFLVAILWFCFRLAVLAAGTCASDGARVDGFVFWHADVSLVVDLLLHGFWCGVWGWEGWGRLVSMCLLMFGLAYGFPTHCSPARLADFTPYKYRCIYIYIYIKKTDNHFKYFPNPIRK